MDQPTKVARLRSARNILVRRSGAMGDVIMTTPILARLRFLVGPTTVIHVMTRTSFVFEDNPHVNEAGENFPIENYDVFIDLDDCYERRREVHAIDAYMLEVFGDAHWPSKQTILHKSPLPRGLALRWSRSVVIHPALTDRSRTIPAVVWEELIRKLISSQITPIIVGRHREVPLPKIQGLVDLSSSLTLQQCASLIQSVRCFISADTGISHVAASTETAIVGIYSSVRPEYRMAWRHGILGWRVTALTADLPCIGCYGGSNCARGDFACVEGNLAISASKMFDAVSFWIEK